MLTRPPMVQEFTKTKTPLIFQDFHEVKKSAMFSECGGQPPSPIDLAPLMIHWTLVDQSILPRGFEREFTAFGDHWEAAAERDDEKKSRWDNVRAAVELHSARKSQKNREDRDMHSRDQFMLAAVINPSRFRTRLQRVRTKVHQQERCIGGSEVPVVADSQWYRIQHQHAHGADGPRQAKQHSALGSGKENNDTEARTRAIRRYVIWLASAFSVPFPSDVSHVVEYLQVKLSEPSDRGSTKGAHQAMSFLRRFAAWRNQTDRRTTQSMS